MKENVSKINQEALKDAKEISINYEKVVRVRQKLFELTNKIEERNGWEKNQITPNDFKELVNQIIELSYVLTSLEIENVIERKYKEKILKEIQENDRNTKEK
jgi:hypothetical protein